VTDKERMLEWLRERKKRITATDVASIMRLEGAYSTPMGVYLDKTDPYIDEGQDVPEYMVWGRKLQGPILEGYAEQTGRRVVQSDPFDLVTIEEHPLLGASLDAEEVDGERSPVEAKNIAVKGPEWGEDGTDEIPQKFYTQLQVQMMVTRTTRAYLAVLFGGRKLAVYVVEYDRDIASAIEEAATRFWKDHVEADVPPPVDGGEDWSRFLRSKQHKYPIVLQADAQIDALGHRLGEVREKIAVLEEQQSIMRNTLLALIDQNAGVKGTGWSATYRRNKDTSTVDYKAALTEACSNSPKLYMDLLSRHTIIKPGYRVFRYLKKEDK
jgi:putative phage-type endonuclease